VPALRARGHEVVACSARKGPESSRVDVGDVQTLSDLDWAVDRVFVFAGVTGTTESFTNCEAYVRGNEIGLLNILECIRLSQSRARVVFPSSRLVYKGSERPLAETAELEAKTIYAANKIGCEFFLRAYANAFGIPYTIFRVCVPNGNSQGSQYSYGTVGNFIRQAMDAGRIRLYGDGGLRRTFTHIDDLCQAVILGSTRDDFENETFNIPGEDLSLLEAAKLIAARLDADIEFAAWPSFDLAIESGSTVFDGGKMMARVPTVVTRNMAEWAESIAPGRAD
jgi:UDP-glucose 4-epimerase